MMVRCPPSHISMEMDRRYSVHLGRYGQRPAPLKSSQPPKATKPPLLVPGPFCLNVDLPAQHGEWQTKSRL